MDNICLNLTVRILGKKSLFIYLFYACQDEVDLLIKAKQIDTEVYQNKYRPVKKQNKDRFKFYAHG